MQMGMSIGLALAGPYSGEFLSSMELSFACRESACEPLGQNADYIKWWFPFLKLISSELGIGSERAASTCSSSISAITLRLSIDVSKY